MAKELNFNEELGPEFTIKVVQYTGALAPGVTPTPPFELAIHQLHLFTLNVGPKTYTNVIETSGISPILTWESGLVTRIDYSGGSYKQLFYNSGVLSYSLYFKAGKPTVRKTVSLNPDSTVHSVIQDTI